jgi:hypothetical protein
MKNVLILVFLALTGCTVMIPGTPWEPEKTFIGPMSSEGTESTVVSRCESGIHFMSNGPCHTAFEIENGRIIELVDIETELGDFLWQTPTFQPWVVPPDYHEYFSLPWSDTRFPYQLHLLTIDPIVVLAVPKRKDDPRHCNSTSYQTGCYTLHRFPDEPLQSKSRPRHIPGSLWFAPSFDKSIHGIPDAATQYSIQLHSSKIELNMVDGFWVIKRITNQKQ